MSDTPKTQMRLSTETRYRLKLPARSTIMAADSQTTRRGKGIDMKAAINQWAFPGDMPAAEAMSLAKRIGFDAFEVCVGPDGPVPLTAAKAEMTAIRRRAEKLDLELTSVGSGLGWQLPMTSPDTRVRRKAKEAMEKALEIAHWLGVGCVLTVPGSVTPDVAYDEAIENALAGIQELLPAAEKYRVAIAIENVWNKFLLSPVEMRDFIDQFESEYVGAYFDIGNVVIYGYPEQWVRILGHRLRMVHAKDYRESAGGFDGFVMLMEGDVDWPKVMAALRDADYDGPLVAEFGPYKHSLEAMLDHVHTSLRAILLL